MIVHNTPVEVYDVNGHEVYVKREDLSCVPPGPPFSKVRGLWEEMSRLDAQRPGVTVGYVETAISMAGWGVAWAGQELGIPVVIYDPQYKKTPKVLAFHRTQWAKFPSTIIETYPAGMAKVNFYVCRKRLTQDFSNSVMLPLGLPFKSSIDATAQESYHIPDIDFKTVVSCVGSGTIFSGLVKSDRLRQAKKVGVLTRSGDLSAKTKKIMASACGGGLLYHPNFDLVDVGYKYAQPEPFPAPFPCHEFYDRKAWRWLVENIASLAEPILFWNIGA